MELETQAKKEINVILSNDFETAIWKENKDDWRRANIVISTVQSFTKNNKYKRIFKIFGEENSGSIISKKIISFRKNKNIDTEKRSNYFNGT